jgi:hypothetical protein
MPFLDRNTSSKFLCKECTDVLNALGHLSLVERILLKIPSVFGEIF